MMRKKRDLMREDLDKAREEIEKITDEELEKEHSKNEKFRKLFIRALAVFLVLLMLTFLYLGSPVYNYIFGLAGSSTIKENNELEFKNEITVRIDDEVLIFLQELYNPLGDERAVCLMGEIKNDEYIVQSYYKPIIFDRGWNYVSHSPCTEGTIIMMHTHPFKRCAPSQTDKNTLRITQQTRPEIIMMVMCGKNRFSAVI
jgi:hypothetical protein